MEQQLRFLEAAVQIIPVLILALIADPSGRDSSKEGNATLVFVALIMGLLGEAFGLSALMADAPDRWGVQLVYFALLVLALAIVWPHGLRLYAASFPGVKPSVKRRMTYLIVVGTQIAGTIALAATGNLWLAVALGVSGVFTTVSTFWLSSRTRPRTPEEEQERAAYRDALWAGLPNPRRERLRGLGIESDEQEDSTSKPWR